MRWSFAAQVPDGRTDDEGSQGLLQAGRQACDDEIGLVLFWKDRLGVLYGSEDRQSWFLTKDGLRPDVISGCASRL